MITLTVFCSACDRNVSIVPRSDKGVRLDRGTFGSIGEVSCLEHGVRCTGTLCPFQSVMPEGRGGARTDRGAAQPAL
jgi:hypothetical protein